MIILGIETSCDETAAAVVKNGREILTNVVASSVSLHRKTGGIIPEVAAREQLKYILPVIKKALNKIPRQKIDALAVTTGPGLIGSLLVGVEAAKALCYTWQKPAVPINHLQAHLYANWLNPQSSTPQLPALGLVVSGGHTDLIYLKNHGQIKWLGGTRDDAAGECFDKCARLLGLGYPGGPAISQAAQKVNHKTRKTFQLPRPMIYEDNFDFSFSGLKTAVLHQVQKNLSLKEKAALAWEIQEAISDVLVTKTKKAMEKYQIKAVLLAGGVIANPRLREKMGQQIKGVPVFIPPINLCTDNATFIASCAEFNFHPFPWSKIQADSSLEIEEVIK